MEFVRGMLGLAALGNVNGFFSNLRAQAMEPYVAEANQEFASFGAVHLNCTSIERAVSFWTKVIGMHCRFKTSEFAEFGSEVKTFVVVHQAAKEPFKPGYSGLYHFAIHAPSEEFFADSIYRIFANFYPCSPTDHTMSKAVYLTDPDGITVEITLETPERLKRIITDRGFKMEDVDGTIRPPSAKLDVAKILQSIPSDNRGRKISNDYKIGHIHFYAADVATSNSFYNSLGFKQFNFVPHFGYADLGAGGLFRHRIALNTWHGTNKPMAPRDCAGLKHFQINFASQKSLHEALNQLNNYDTTAEGFWLNDPTGNRVLLSNS